MTTPNAQAWIRVDITFIKLSDPTTTKTLSFTDRPIIGTGATTPTSWPLLLDIDGLGLSVGQRGVPTQSEGTITILDSYECFGEEQRVFDQLQEYTPNEQTVLIYDALGTIDQTDPTSLWTLRWKGKCKDVEKSFDGDEDELRFSVESLALPERVITASTDQNWVTEPSDLSAGKYLPIILGSQFLYVPSIRLNEGTTCQYAYATEFATQHYVSAYYSAALKRYAYSYAKDSEGNYRDAYNGINTTPNGSYTVNTNAQGLTERAYELIDLDTNEEYYGIITGGTWRFKGQNNIAITPSGNLFFVLWELDEVGGVVRPIKEVASAVVQKSTYLSSVRGASNFDVSFVFDKPYVSKNDGREPTRYGLAISLRMTNYDTATTDFVDRGFTDAGLSVNTWTRYGYNLQVGNNVEWSAPTVTTESACFTPSFAYVNQINQYSGENGLNGAAQEYITGTGQNQSLDIVVYTNGLSDDVTATITGGSPYDPIEYPHHVVKMLTREYSSTTGLFSDSSDWDWSKFSSIYSSLFTSTSARRRKVSGFTQGRVTLADLLADLCEEHALKIIQLNNGKFALWAWGTTQPVVRVFSDEDIRVLGYRRLDASSVVNRVKLAYKRGSLINNSANKTSSLNEDNFDAFVTIDNSTYSQPSELSEKSNAIYSDKYIEKTDFKFVNDETTLYAILEYYLSTYDHPHTMVQIECSYWENRDLELLDIIEIVSASLPATGGTTREARTPTYGGEQTKVFNGRYQYRAQRYRCQIMSKRIDWAKGSAVTLQLEVRIIKPYHENEIT